eukprot:1181011-Prorocentrum_minimum.AAC.2
MGTRLLGDDWDMCRCHANIPGRTREGYENVRNIWGVECILAVIGTGGSEYDETRHKVVTWLRERAGARTEREDVPPDPRLVEQLHQRLVRAAVRQQTELDLRVVRGQQHASLRGDEGVPHVDGHTRRLPARHRLAAQRVLRHRLAVQRGSKGGPNEVQTKSKRSPNGVRTKSKRGPKGVQSKYLITTRQPRRACQPRRCPETGRPPLDPLDPLWTPSGPPLDPLRTPFGPTLDLLWPLSGLSLAPLRTHPGSPSGPPPEPLWSPSRPRPDPCFGTFRTPCLRPLFGTPSCASPRRFRPPHLDVGVAGGEATGGGAGAVPLAVYAVVARASRVRRRLPQQRLHVRAEGLRQRAVLQHQRRKGVAPAQLLQHLRAARRTFPVLSNTSGEAEARS